MDDLEFKAAQTAQHLIDHPLSIPSFFQMIGEHSANPTVQEKNLLDRYLMRVTGLVNSFNWEQKRDIELPLEDEKAIRRN